MNFETFLAKIAPFLIVWIGGCTGYYISNSLSQTRSLHRIADALEHIAKQGDHHG